MIKEDHKPVKEEAEVEVIEEAPEEETDHKPVEVEEEEEVVTEVAAVVREEDKLGAEAAKEEEGLKEREVTTTDLVKMVKK